MFIAHVSLAVTFDLVAPVPFVGFDLPGSIGAARTAMPKHPCTNTKCGAEEIRDRVSPQVPPVKTITKSGLK